MTKEQDDARTPLEGVDETPNSEEAADADGDEREASVFDEDALAFDRSQSGLNQSDSEQPDPAELTMLLEDSRAKADEANNQLLRLRAEMENMSRRQAKELENAHKFALEGFVKELLQVRDSLELGQAAAEAPDADVAKLREGTELTLKLLRDVMTKFGVERIEPEGEPFNPDYHQAMSMQPRSDVPPNTVVNVVQSGYLLNGRLVRPALVMVSQAA
ncbi:nucleotide exchange factor GrpE [Halochromatium salexigens]|uniref:Protein GrpE n=1 Tax=Halochromatium salexigens TaxID=49447 RepID=A0AAJ0XFR7_HALSE|nr:nucleotide exchange factor GrpE [Halochromatium salexigens]MBK5930658.1 nucleotide exchange factor GrpE [Halochromatium salexigens]